MGLRICGTEICIFLMATIKGVMGEERVKQDIDKMRQNKGKNIQTKSHYQVQGFLQEV